MTAKEYLSRGLGLDKEIEALLEAKRLAYDRCTSATAQTDRIPGGTITNNVLDSYTEFSDEIDRQVKELNQIKTDISRTIHQVPNQKLRRVLIDRYLNLKKFEQIALDTPVDYRWLMRLHKRALMEVDKLLPPD